MKDKEKDIENGIQRKGKLRDNRAEEREEKMRIYK